MGTTRAIRDASGCPRSEDINSKENCEINMSNMSGGRWNSPAQNADNFMSANGASCCQAVSHNSHRWRKQGDDITTAIEKLEKQKSMLFGSSPNFSKTVSMPAWSSSQSSRSSSPSSSTGGWPQFRDRPTNYSLSSSQMSSSPVSLGKMSSSSSSWRCSSSSYNDDRLLQMD